MKRINTILRISSLVFLLASCGPAKKMLNYSKESNQAVKVAKAKLATRSKKMLEQANIDSTIYKALVARFDQLDQRIEERSDIMNNKVEKLGRKSANKLLDSLQKQMQTEGVALDILNASLDIKSFYEFPSESFFGPGVYSITDEKIDAVKTIYSPVIDSIAVFAKGISYDTLDLYMVTYGYADGQGFREGSNLYNELSKKLNKEAPTKVELNQKISELRASTIAEFLKKYVEESNSKISSPSYLNKSSLAIGMGETFPNKEITDYQDNDARRRIVKFYWKLLPVIH